MLRSVKFGVVTLGRWRQASPRENGSRLQELQWTSQTQHWKRGTLTWLAQRVGPHISPLQRCTALHLCCLPLPRQAMPHTPAEDSRHPSGRPVSVSLFTHPACLPLAPACSPSGCMRTKPAPPTPAAKELQHSPAIRAEAFVPGPGVGQFWALPPDLNPTDAASLHPQHCLLYRGDDLQAGCTTGPPGTGDSSQRWAPCPPGPQLWLGCTVKQPEVVQCSGGRCLHQSKNLAGSLVQQRRSVAGSPELLPLQLGELGA